MRFFAGILLLPAALGLASLDLWSQEISETDRLRAQQAIQGHGKALKAELQAALKSGGPSAAVEACQLAAPGLALQASQASGLEVGRVSLRNRNPGNAPNEWQKAVLEEFDRRQAEGEPIEEMSWSGTLDDGRFAYMKAIGTQAICLACHGSELAPELESIIQERYPADKATGYRAGEVRGAFVAIGQAAPPSDH